MNFSYPSKELVCRLIKDLSLPSTKKNALIELSKIRQNVPDLGVWLWHSFGTVTSLMQEIVMIYPSIIPPTLTASQSNSICNILALLQCVAAHPETRSAFLSANIPHYIYPFINAPGNTRPLEYLRLTSLGVIGTLVKSDDSRVINFLIKTDIVPLCLNIMRSSPDLSKIVATFIIQKILLDDGGLIYACDTYDRFYHVACILGKMVCNISREPAVRNETANLLRHVIRCYLRLSDDPRGREALRQCLPEHMRNGTFLCYFKEDDPARNWLYDLAKNLEIVHSCTVPAPDERSYGI